MPPQDYDPEEEGNQDSQGQPAPADREEPYDRQHPKSEKEKRGEEQRRRGLGGKIKDEIKKEIDPQEKLKSLTDPKRLAKQFGRQAIKQAGKELIIAPAKAFVAAQGTPIGWAMDIIIAIIILIIIIIVIIAGGGDSEEQACQNQGAGATISKQGPESVANGTEIKYTISATYPGQADDMTVTDTFPADTTFVSATGKYTEQKTGDKTTSITWSAKDNGGSQGTAASEPASSQASSSSQASGHAQTAGNSSAMFPMQFDVVIKSDKNDVYIINKSTVSVSGGQANCCQAGASGAVSEGYTPPSTNTCGGKVKINNPTSKNFGDPNCSFDKNKLHQLLQQKAGGDADNWFNIVVACESAYNPNAYVSHAAAGTPDGAGAWGLYQMGSSSPPGSAPPAAGKNGPLDRGDVNWEMQTANAVGYKQKIGNKWTYWQGAQGCSATGGRKVQ